LLLAFFTLGFAAIVAQVVLMREFLVVLGGNELVIGLIMASWLLEIACGAWIGALAADRFISAKSFFLVSLFLMATALPLQIALLRNARGILGISTGEGIPLLAMLIFCPLATAPTSLLVGFIFPFAGRLGAEARGGGKKAATGVADLYVAESVGSLAGGLLFTFFMVEALSPMQAAFFNTALLGAGGFAVALGLTKPVVRSVVTGIFVLLVAAAGFGLPAFALDVDRELDLVRWRQNVGEIELTAVADSRYQHIEVGRAAEQYNLYLNGSPSGYVPSDYSHAQLAHFILSQHPDPKKILIIGNGAEGLLPALVKYRLDRIDYALQDDEVLRLLRPFKSDAQLRAADDPRIRIRRGDGRRFVQRTTLSWDVIIALIPPPSNAMLNRYFTIEFFSEVRARLNPGGVFVLPLPMTPGHVGGIVGSFIGSIADALRSVFDEIVFCPEPNNLTFCSPDGEAVTSDIDELSRRWRSRGIAGEPFHESLFAGWLEPHRVAERRAAIDALPPSGLNSDLQPAAYLYRLLIWNRTSATERGAADAINDTILAIRGMTPWPIAFAIALALAATLGIRRLRKKPAPRFVGLVVIATTGFTVMALEIMLIFTYQNLFGYIYHEIGLIVALFMAGLAIGAGFGRRLLSGDECLSRRRLLFFEVMLLALCILFPLAAAAGASLLTSVPGGGLLLIGLLLAAGIAAGAQFSLAIDFYLRNRSEKVGAGAGAVDASDHLGAALGAAVTGVILIPVFGIWATALLLACLKAASATLLLRY